MQSSFLGSLYGRRYSTPTRLSGASAPIMTLAQASISPSAERGKIRMPPCVPMSASSPCEARISRTQPYTGRWYSPPSSVRKTRSQYMPHERSRQNCFVRLSAVSRLTFALGQTMIGMSPDTPYCHSFCLETKALSAFGNHNGLIMLIA